MTELEKVLAGLLDEEWGRQGTDIALIARPSKLAKFLAPHIERARNEATATAAVTDYAEADGNDAFIESLREALNDER